MRFNNVLNKIINRIIRKSSWFKHEKFDGCSKFWELNTFNLDVVNLGSTSGVMAFDYEDIPLKTANWALSRNPLLGDKEILFNYSSFLKSGHSIVIISLCPFSSLSGSYTYFDDRYYTILHMSSIPNCSYRKKMEVLGIKNNPINFYPLRSLFKDTISFLLFWRNSDNVTRSEDYLRKDAKQWMNSWMKEFNILNQDNPLSLINKDAIDDAYSILCDMISYCSDMGIKPVMIIPPVYNTLGSLFTDDFKQKIIEDLVDRVKCKYKDLFYYNYMNDPSFCNDSSLFQNSFFLNKKGAQLFTKRVLSDLSLL